MTEDVLKLHPASAKPEDPDSNAEEEDKKPDA
jgi:hypothetical protein